MSTAHTAITTTCVLLSRALLAAAVQPMALPHKVRWFLTTSAGSKVIEAKTPQAALGVEGDDPRLNAR